MPLVSVAGNPNTHGGGSLIAGNPQTVKVKDIPVIEHSDSASPDALCPPLGGAHCNPETASGSPNVFVYRNPLHRHDDPRTCGASTIVDSQTTVFVNEPGQTVDGVFVSDNPYQDVWVEKLIKETGANAPHDTPEDTPKEYQTKEQLPPANEGAETEEKPAAKDEGEPTECGDFKTDPIDYSQKLSSNFTIKSVSAGCLFAHTIVAQNGLTEADIICNLKAVCENILEPLSGRYPGFRINSGFRRGESTSQHNRGMAVDLQWPGISPADYTPIAQWIRDNLPFDQLIFEHGNSIWLHVSYNRTAGKQRGQQLTYYPKATPNYKPGLTNYYA